MFIIESCQCLTCYDNVMNKKRKILVASVILIIAILVMLALYGAGIIMPGKSTVTGHASSASGDAAANALLSVTADPQALVSPIQKGTINTNLAVPRGSYISIDATTWRAAGVNAGTIQAVMYSPFRLPASLLVVMHRQDGHWYVLSTIPIH